MEGLRADSLYLGPLRVSQLLSFLALAGLSLLLVCRRRGAPRVLRALIVCAVVLLGLCLGIDGGIFCVFFAALLLAAAGMLYMK